MNITQQAQLSFIERLNSEFIQRSGYGAYVHLTPLDIQKMFKNYIHQRLPLSKYIKKTVKEILG